MQILDGRYRLVRRLGTGGMGSVYVGERLQGGGTVAIKLLNPGEMAQSPGMVQRFYREVRATRALNAPNVVRLFDAGVDPEAGAPYMVMELLDGEDLHQFTRHVGPLDPDLALRIAAQICAGLQHAHERGVVHRDIKAANLFLARAGGSAIVVKILDFGIAKTGLAGVNVGDLGLTKTGVVLGSPLYMSPEQARGSKEIDHRSDLWSLGVVLFRMLAGNAPFQHVQGMANIMVAICTMNPPPVQNLAPWVPPEIAAIVDRALKHNPAARYQSAAEMRAALRALLPHGDAIVEPMLTALDPARRAVIAPRFVPQTLPPPAPSAPPPPGRTPLDPGAGLDDPDRSSRPPSFGGTRERHSELTARGVAASAYPAVASTRAWQAALVLSAALLGAGLTAGVQWRKGSHAHEGPPPASAAVSPPARRPEPPAPPQTVPGPAPQAAPAPQATPPLATPPLATTQQTTPQHAAPPQATPPQAAPPQAAPPQAAPPQAAPPAPEVYPVGPAAAEMPAEAVETSPSRTPSPSPLVPARPAWEASKPAMSPRPAPPAQPQTPPASSATPESPLDPNGFGGRE